MRQVVLLTVLLVVSRAEALQEGLRHLWIGLPIRQEEHLVAPLMIDDFSGVVAGDIDLLFDSQRVAVVEVRPTELLAGFALFSNAVGDTLKISFAGFQAGAGNGVLLEIEITVEDPGTVPHFAFAAVSLAAFDGTLIPVEYEVPTVVEEEGQLPGGADLALNFPNPFNAQTTIEFSLVELGPVKLAVYDLAGQLVRVLVEGERPAGMHQILWDGRDDRGSAVASGVYLYHLETGPFTAVKKLALVR